MAKIPVQIRKKVKAFAEKISQELTVKRVILFGSYAKGTQHEGSDIDVCIIAENISNNFSAMLQIAPKILDVDVNIEPVVFSEKDYNETNTFGLLREIKAHGVEV